MKKANNNFSVTPQLVDLKDAGQRLRYARKQKGYTQKELGYLLGYAPETISRMENGKVPYPLNSAIGCKLFNIGINDMAISYGVEQKINPYISVIFVSDDPIELNGYLVNNNDINYKLEHTTLALGAQLCFTYTGSTFEGIDKGDRVFVNHYEGLNKGDLIVIGKSIYKYIDAHENLITIENSEGKFDYIKIEELKHYIGKVVYVLKNERRI